MAPGRRCIDRTYAWGSHGPATRIHRADQKRSVPFGALDPLWRVGGVRWFSLQVEPRA